MQTKALGVGHVLSERDVDDGTVTKKTKRFDRCEAFASEQAYRDMVENCKVRLGYQGHHDVSNDNQDVSKCVLDELAKPSHGEAEIPGCGHFKSEEACLDKIDKCKAELLSLGLNVIHLEDERFQACILKDIPEGSAREFDLDKCRGFPDETDCRFAWYKCKKDLLSRGYSINDQFWKPKFSECMQGNLEQIDRDHLAHFRYDKGQGQGQQPALEPIPVMKAAMLIFGSRTDARTDARVSAMDSW